MDMFRARSDSQAESQTEIQALRARTRNVLSSNIGHYSVMGLVFLDFLTILGDFVVELSLCEYTCKGENPNAQHTLERAHLGLGIVSLVFSCTFLVELIVSIWAYGPSFFKSKFHIFDALIIVLAFIVDAFLEGTFAEIGSVIVILRLFRIVKIMDELTAGAQEHNEATEGFISRLEAEIKTLKEELTLAQMHTTLTPERRTR